MPDAVDLQRLNLYVAARTRAVRFLLAQSNSDGSIGPVQERVFYYRVPWALALAGETSAAMAVLAWIARHVLTSDGELDGGPSEQHGRRRTANTYAEANLAYGAYLLGRFDIAQRTMHFALCGQDAESGGVFMDAGRGGPNDHQLLYLTAQLGMSAALTGWTASAVSAGKWLRRVWETQPDLPARLYTIWSPSEGLVTSVPDGADAKHYIDESQQTRQYHYNGGIAAAFLCRLYFQTDDTAWLALAREYQQFSMQSTPTQFETKQVCKSAWGADGSWTNTPYLSPNPTLADRIELTAEFAVHLDTIIGALTATSLAHGGVPAAPSLVRSGRVSPVRD
ncbi:MAG: hypothetical protein M3069_03295 [Chloroflexota bacterium]|nr:hypothetical protein [Chloroflexota bacterium]